MPKANADYPRLLRYAQADFEHFQLRVKRTDAELRKLLKNVPEGARIMQMVTAHGGNVADLADATTRVERYQRLVAKGESENGQEQTPETE